MVESSHLPEAGAFEPALVYLTARTSGGRWNARTARKVISLRISQSSLQIAPLVDRVVRRSVLKHEGLRFTNQGAKGDLMIRFVDRVLPVPQLIEATDARRSEHGSKVESDARRNGC